MVPELMAHRYYYRGTSKISERSYAQGLFNILETEQRILQGLFTIYAIDLMTAQGLFNITEAEERFFQGLYDIWVADQVTN